MSSEHDIELVRKHLSALGEHFDAVQIFCTSYEPGEDGGTKHIHMGGGNWFARYGLVKDWITAVEQNTRNDVTSGSDE